MIFLRINLPNFVQFKQYYGNSENATLCYDPLESDSLGAQSACAQPPDWGPVPRPLPHAPPPKLGDEGSMGRNEKIREGEREEERWAPEIF